jgi:carbamoyl-phosphate synthase small subunit
LKANQFSRKIAKITTSGLTPLQVVCVISFTFDGLLLNRSFYLQEYVVSPFSPALLALADGTLFQGVSIGIPGISVGEVVFNTAMTGYQEILTDPSYCRQLITLTYPHIGNTGTNSADMEAATIFASGLIIRDLPLLASNWRNEMSLAEFLQVNKVVAIADIDTRKLTRILRDKGAQGGCIMTGAEAKQAIARAQDFGSMGGRDLAREVSCKAPYPWLEGVWDLTAGFQRPTHTPYHVVAFDYGIKHNILRMLSARGCQVTVVPATTSAAEALRYKPDGIFLSNGPGDPAPCTYAIDTIQQLLAHTIPMFGICLGHQLLGLAAGAKTVKMKFGHHGANHPVQDCQTQQVLITSQNHGFQIDEASLPSTLKVTHRSLFDQTVQGIRFIDKPVFGFQGHPEASPGPHDMGYLFDQFIGLMQQQRL